MKLKSFLVAAVVGVSLSANAQNTAKSAVTSNIVDQGTRGITAEKTKNTLNSIIDWVGTPSVRRLTVVQLRALNTDWPSAVHVTDANGVFTLDAADLATSDDGVNTLVTTSGAKRYKRVIGTIASITGLQTAIDSKAPIANARLTGQVGVNVVSPSYDVDAAGSIRAQAGAVMGSGTLNANAILDLQSTNKVFLPPRMTQAQRLSIASGAPAAGAIVYQTDGTPGLYYYVNSTWRKLFNSSGELLPANLVGGAGIISNAEYESLYGLRTATTIQQQIDSRTHKDSLNFSWNSTNGTLGLTGINGGSIINLNTWGNSRYLQTTTANSNYAKYASINRFRSSNIFYPAIALKDSSGASSYGTYTLGTYDGGGSDRSFGIGFQGTSLFQPNIFTIHNGNVGILTDNPTTRFHVNSKSFFGTGSNPLTAPETFMLLAPRTTNTSNVNSNTLSLFGHVNQSGSGGHTELYISPYYQTTGSNPRYLIDAGTNSAASGGGTHTRLFSVSHNGSTYIAGSLVVDGVSPIYSDAGIRARGLAGIFLAQSIPDVQSRYSAYQWKINGTADNDYNASFMLQHTHKYDMFASANTYTPLRIYQNKVTIGANTLPTEVLTVAGNASVAGNVANTGNIVANGNLNIGEGSDATAKVITVGNGRTANGTVGINFIGDTGGNSGLSIQRQGSAGVNSVSELIHRGTGQFRIHAYEAADIDFATAGTSRAVITSTGSVGIGRSVPVSRLHINAPTGLSVISLSRSSFASGLNIGGVGFSNAGSTNNYVTAITSTYGTDSTTARLSFRAGTANTSLYNLPEVATIVNGKFGIQSTDPQQYLDINGLNRVPATTGSSGDGIARFRTTGGATSLDFGGYSTGGYMWIQSRSNTDFSVNYNLALQPNGGFVGLGLTAPASMLDMKGKLTLTASDNAKSNSIEGGYSMNGGARTLLFDNSSSTATEGFMFRNSNTNTNIMSILNRGNVGIGTTLPHISTVLDLVSTTAGLGLPRMTTTQINAIATPQAGLTVYNTTLSKLCYYNGTAWKQVTDSNM